MLTPYKRMYIDGHLTGLQVTRVHRVIPTGVERQHQARRRPQSDSYRSGETASSTALASFPSCWSDNQQSV